MMIDATTTASSIRSLFYILPILFHPSHFFIKAALVVVSSPHYRVHRNHYTTVGTTTIRSIVLQQGASSTTTTHGYHRLSYKKSDKFALDNESKSNDSDDVTLSFVSFVESTLTFISRQIVFFDTRIPIFYPLILVTLGFILSFQVYIRFLFFFVTFFVLGRSVVAINDPSGVDDDDDDDVESNEFLSVDLTALLGGFGSATLVSEGDFLREHVAGDLITFVSTIAFFLGVGFIASSQPASNDSVEDEDSASGKKERFLMDLWDDKLDRSVTISKENDTKNN